MALYTHLESKVEEWTIYWSVLNFIQSMKSVCWWVIFNKFPQTERDYKRLFVGRKYECVESFKWDSFQLKVIIEIYWSMARCQQFSELARVSDGKVRGEREIGIKISPSSLCTKLLRTVKICLKKMKIRWLFHMTSSVKSRDEFIKNEAEYFTCNLKRISTLQ